MKIELCFKVKTIMFRDSDSKYSIIKGIITEYKGKEKISSEITIKGVFPTLYLKDEFSGSGEYQLDENRGYYISLNEIPVCIIPENKKSLAEFISNRVRGLSKKKAIEIVETLGLQVLTRIKQNPEVLLQVNGIKEAKAKKIYEQLILHESFESLAIFIQSLGIPISIANRIYQVYGEDSLLKIKQDPYLICNKDNKIKFLYIDKIAVALNIAKNNNSRVETAILKFLEYRSNHFGDICILKDMLYEKLNSFLDHYGYTKPNHLLQVEIEDGLERLIQKGEVILEKGEDGIIYIYKSIYNHIENKIIENISKLLTVFKNPFCREEDIKNFLDAYEANYFTLDNKQKEAVYTSLLNGISILNGGPGTGKSQTINVMVKCIKYINPSGTISLLAPTGRASERLRELTNLSAKTIHREIRLIPFTAENELEEITSDYVFIDETSMIDAYTFERLTTAISENTRVVFVGDVEQLPSVGAGLIFRDLIESKKIPLTKLTKIFRQAEQSDIVINSHKMIKGIDTKAKNGFQIQNKKGSNFVFWAEDNPVILKNKIIKSVERLIEKYHFKLSDISILVPMRVGELGMYQLNTLLQETFNPPSLTKSEYKIDETHCFRVGDKVMQIVNNYDLNVFNGSVGTIVNIYVESDKGFYEHKIVVEYPQMEDSIVYSDEEIEELELAYAVTIHKSQGSEYPAVVMPVHNEYKVMLNRNLFYTGMTRAKQMLVVIGQEEALNYAIWNIENINRVSRLKEKLNQSI